MRNIFVIFCLLFATGAHAVEYRWTGTCDGLDGSCVGAASALLVLSDSYTPGQPVSLSDFVSFTYTSSTGVLEVPGDIPLRDFSGTLPESSGPGDVVVDFDFGTGSTAAVFDPDGTFFVNCLQDECPIEFEDDGTDGLFTLLPDSVAVPVMPAGWLACLVFLLIALAARKRMRGAISR